MGYMRPGTKVRFWTPRVKNKPSVDPPGMLKIVAALSILSVVGVLVYAAALTITSTSSVGLKTEVALYIALLHFLLPLGIAYTISTNSPLSRTLITAYSAILYCATLLGKGYLGRLQTDTNVKLVVATGLLVVIVVWLFRSPKMRVYYALISGSALPGDLPRPIEELVGPGPVERWIARVSNAVLPFAEFAIVLLIIAAVIYGFLVAYGGW